jgi:signal transduction histidine kinase/ligand-binding sensor domain-containing protein/DNA-binding response OmpR family regulator
MPMLQRRFLIIFILFFISSDIFAQRGQIQFSQLTLSNGLSHNQVNAILKDAKGFVWFATFSGLNRFDGHEFKVFKHDPRNSSTISDDFITDIFELPDHKLYLNTRSGPNIYNPETETFIRNTKDYLKKTGINAKVIHNILKDSAGDFWFNAFDEGIFKYDVLNKRTIHLKFEKNNSHTLFNTPVSAIQKDPNGNIWIIHSDKTIEMLDRKTGRVLKRILIFQQKNPANFQDFKLFVDNSSGLWIYTLNNQRGIDYYNPVTQMKYFIDKGAAGLNSNLISGILQDADGRIWIGTDHGGVNLLNKNNFNISYLLHKEDDLKSIGQNSITCLYKDASGIIWVGTFKKGVSFFHEKILKFPLYRHQWSNPNGLTYDDVNRFAEDDLGNLWIGTNGGGLFYFNRKTGYFKNYKHQQSDPRSLSNDIIVSLFIDRHKKLWIGTYFGGLDCFDGGNFKHYRYDRKDTTSLADDRVWDIKEDRKGNLWVATLNGGLDKLDRNTNTFVHKRASKNNSIQSNSISCLLEDKAGNIWIGTSDGIDQMKTDGRFIHYGNKAGASNTLINNVVYDLMEDSYGFIWIATRDGLSRLDPKTGKFRNFEAKDGLQEKATLKIIEDDHKNLWLSTANGLVNIIVKKHKNDFSYTFRNYDEHDGLQGNAFNANAGYKTRRGELLFGGANGFNLFRPESINSDDSKPVIIIAGLQIENKDVNIGERIDGRILLNKSIIFTDKIELKYNQNGFALELAALNFFNPKKIRYRYKLEGFDQHWQELQENGHRATYTNIDPGAYIFKVFSTDASGNWTNNQTSLNIIISPPFWRTWIAYTFYVLLAGGTLLLIRRRGILRLKKEFLIKQERQQARRMHELDLLKIKFLTNVSHEFRTPLSLIINPLEKLIRQAGDSEKQQLQLIHRNGKRLLNLVNQLLDFRKMEVQELKLHPKTGDIISFIKELCLSFGDIADRKNISFHFQSEMEGLIALFDHDKIERIVFNLLSNAFKFTPQGGKISVKLSNGEKQSSLIMQVSDTGIGITAAQKERIFERFFQGDMPDSIVNQGSGIGLSITKEFVKLHGGDIWVESQVNEGTTFTVSLELPERNPETAQTLTPIEVLMNAGVKEYPEPEGQLVWKSKKPLLLLIEDNEDFRFYLKDNLKEYYQIIEAANGKEGWRKILSHHPEVVVSDVSMPEMNGIDLCKKIKSDKRTAHLPVILLTALTTDDQQLTGLETGANDYMTKPFNFEILLSKIRNLLQQQALSKKTYQKQVDFQPSETKVESVDDKFIRQLSLQIEKHLADSSYSVDQLSTDMNMSRVGLYKKILSLTGKSPIEYIRFYRLQKAKPLLLKSQMTVAEVAYQVGFSNPKHFSRSFKQEFNILPSVYALTKSDKGIS